MAFAGTDKLLKSPASVATGPATTYTVDTNRIGKITQIHVANTTGSAATYTCSVGADAAGTRLVSAESIAANATKEYFFSPGVVLAAAATIQEASGTNNALTSTIIGQEAST